METLREIWDGLSAGQQRWATVGFIIVGSFVAAWVVDKAICGALQRWTRRTSTLLDDDLLRIVHGPITKTVVFIGLGLATWRLGLEERTLQVTLAILWTLGVVVWMIFGFRFCGIVLRSASVHADRYRFIEQRTIPLFDNLGKVIVGAIALYALIVIWKVDATGWLASAGIAGIAVGFAAKDTLSNLFAGVFILADAPYTVGDFVVLNEGQRGEVVNIGLRSTRIRTRDDIEITIPNAVMGSGMITNESSMRARKTPTRIRVRVGVAYGSDIDQVRAVLLSVAEADENIGAEPEPRVRFRTFGDSGLDFELLGWISDPARKGRTIDALNTAVYKRFAEEGIEIPYPKRDVYVHQITTNDGETA